MTRRQRLTIGGLALAGVVLATIVGWKVWDGRGPNRPATKIVASGVAAKPTTTTTTTSTTTTTTTTTTVAPTTTTVAPEGSTDGKVIVIDPGHNEHNAQHT